MVWLVTSVPAAHRQRDGPHSLGTHHMALQHSLARDALASSRSFLFHHSFRAIDFTEIEKERERQERGENRDMEK